MAEAALNNAGDAGNPGGAPGAGNDQTWATGFDEDTRGWLGGMGVDKLPPDQALAKVIPMYRGAEKKLGVPADRLFTLPKDENDAEGFRAAMTKLGLPENPDGYELKAPEGDPGTFLKTATGWMHELGIPKSQAHGLAAKWNEYVQGQTAAAVEAQKVRNVEDYATLEKEWGDQYDAKIELGNRVIRAAGLSEDEAKQITNAIGLKRAATLFAYLGGAMGEHNFKGGEHGGNRFQMSPAELRAKIGSIEADPAYHDAASPKHASLVQEAFELRKLLYPEQA